MFPKGCKKLVSVLTTSTPIIEIGKGVVEVDETAGAGQGGEESKCKYSE